MNKRMIWAIIPTVLIPYLGLFALSTIIFSTKCSFFEYIMVSIFRSNALNLIAVLLLCCIIAILINIICFANSIRKGWNALSLAKSAMIIKLIHVPAYILSFILGIFLTIAIFTIPFSIGLFLLACLTLFLSSLFTIASIINTVRQGVFKRKDILWIILLQFVFCADVVASIVFYSKLKREYIIQKDNA